nr:unnamed protein product [Spirometra erinaceieuropaei]
MTTSAYLDTLGNKFEGLEYERQRISRLHEETSRIQKKTYTNWINGYLKKCSMEVVDLYKDLQDGKRLLKLMELISRANLGKPNKGALRVQKIENVGRALNYIKTKVQLENIGAEDIVDGNPTLTLGLIWTIILRFQIDEIGLQMTINQTIDLSSKIHQYEASIQALLRWIRDKTKYFNDSTQSLPATIEELTQLINNFAQYRRGEKSQKYEERAKLEELLFKIDLLTKDLRARAYMPNKPELQLTTLERAWDALGQSEHAYELALRDAYNRLEKLEQMAKRFNNRAGLLEDWLDTTERLMDDLLNHPGTQAGAAKKAEAVSAEVQSKGRRFDALDKITQSLTRARYPNVSKISDRNGRIQNRWSQISGPKMKTLLSFLQFPQRRSELLEQMDLTVDRIQELGKQLTTPIKAEQEAQNATSRKGPASISYEVVQAALDRHLLAEAELSPLERKLLQIRNALEQLWHDAPPSPTEGNDREGDMARSDKSIQLWNEVAARGRERKARLEAMSASYNISAGLAQELNWVNEKLQLLEKTAQQARDTRTARDLQLAQRLCKNHQTLDNEVNGHNHLWEDIKRTAEQFLSSRSVGPSGREQPTDSRDTIQRQLEATTAAWDQLRAEMTKRKSALDECLESAQFYADAEEAKRWIQEKVTLIETAGILTKPLESRNDLDRAFKYCGVNSSATTAQQRRLKDLRTEMEVFNGNDLQRLKYISSLLRKPMDNRRMKPEMLKRHNEDVEAEGASSDSSIDSAPGKKEATHTEGSAVAIGSYHSKDPAGRDISLSKGETVAVIECTNNDWWHIRKTINGIQREGFVPANRLRLIQAPVLRRESSKKDAHLAVKRGVSRGLSIRRVPSARNVNQLHFDSEHILLCEKSVMEAYEHLEDIADERGDCLQDTLAWHEFDHKCNILEQWMQTKQDVLSAADQTSDRSSSRRGSFDGTIDEITATYPRLAEIEELADILTGKVPCKKRKIYQRNDGPLFYKKLAEESLKEIQDKWKQLDELKRAQEVKRASTGSINLFEKKADTLELLLGDRIGQLQLMENYAKDPAANAGFQRQIKGIQMELPTLEEKMRELRVLADSVMKSYPKEAAAVQNRMNQIDQLWEELKNLLKEKADKLTEAADTLELQKRLQELSSNLDDAEEQIHHMKESDQRRIVPKNASALECLLPSDCLRDAARKADDLDETLNLYDREAEDLCMQANSLPPERKDKNDVCQAAEGLAMRNEGLKRDLANRKQALENALGAQALNDNLNAIEARIKEDSVRLDMTEPLFSAPDVDREKRRVADIKLDLERNKAAIDAVQEKIKASELPTQYSVPLTSVCERLHGEADRALGRAAERDKELEDSLNRVRFHDEVSDLDDWLGEKQAIVQNIQDFVDKCADDAMPLQQIRDRMARLQAVSAEVKANEPAVENLKKTAHGLPQSRALTGFPDPIQEADRLSDSFNKLQKDIDDTQNKLERAVAISDLHSMPFLSPVTIQPVKADMAYAAAPGLDGQVSPDLPRNLAEALAALKNAQNERKNILDNLEKIQAAEDKAKKAGALTPALKEKLDRERERAEDLCMQANSLPPERKDKNDVCQAAEGLAMRNEGLKRDLANRKQALENALGAQALNDNLNAIEARIKEDSVRLDMTEPLFSAPDVDREKRRVADIKLDLERNKAAIDAVQEKIKASEMPTQYSVPLTSVCERLHSEADRALGRAAERDKELEDSLNRVRFHDEVSDLDDWLGEKQAIVQNIQDFVDKCADDAVPLQQIRDRMARLQAVSAEVKANEPAVENLKKTAHSLPQSKALTGFPDPIQEADRLSENFDKLQKDIDDTQNKLERAVAISDLHSMPFLSPVTIQPVKADMAYAAAPGLGGQVSPDLPRNLAEALAALKNAQNERKNILDNLEKIQAAEDKAKKAGALTPALKEKLDRERERQKAKLADADDDIKRNEDLVAWYKLANEMTDIKDWADAKIADLTGALDGKQAPRTPHEQTLQQQKHDRLCKDIERKDPRVKELLDPQICPMPACLQQAAIPGSDPRPELAESFGELKRMASERSKQLLASVDTIDLLSQLDEVTQQINSNTVAVDAVVNSKSTYPLDSAAKKLKEIDQAVQKLEPVIDDLSQKVDQQLATIQNDRSPLIKPLKKARKGVIDALRDLKDRISAAKRSLVLQDQIANFMQLSEDQQEDITKALAFVSSANVGSNSDPNVMEQRWQTFLEELPKLLSRIDECISEGSDLAGDLVRPYKTTASGVIVMPVRQKKNYSQPCNHFNLSPEELQTPLQMEYPLCNEQSARAAADQVQEQIEGLARDRQLLQKQVQACETRKENSEFISSFERDWADIMERIKEKDAHLTALSSVPPKSQTLLKAQVSKHEVLEAEVVHIKQRASEVEQVGNSLLMQLRSAVEGQGNRTMEAQKVSDKINALRNALQGLDDKLTQRRHLLNQCDRYLRFCEQVHLFVIWCKELDQEVASTAVSVKASANAITSAVDRLFQTEISSVAPTVGTGSSIDLKQAQLQSSTYERLNEEMRKKWSPLSTALVQEAEDMINLNHYAADDLNAKVEQLLIAQKRAEEGLKEINWRVPQLIDLLCLRREIASLVSQLTVQRARLHALVKECSSSADLQSVQCDKLTSSAEVEAMKKRVDVVDRVLQSTLQKETSVVSSANQMIHKGHYASKDIREGIDQYSKARQNLVKDCANLSAGLDRCNRQLTWEEEAKEFESWLRERETELADLSKPQVERTTSGDVILDQLNTLQRQENFQNSVSANSSHAEALIKQAEELIAEESRVTNCPNSAVSQRIAGRLEKINQRWKALLASCRAIAAALDQSRDLLAYQTEADALERWLRDKDILLAKGDLGSDYDHCISLKEKAKEPAAGKIVNDQTMQSFGDLANRVSKALRTATSGDSSGGAAPLAALNQRTAEYIDRRTADIQDRWKKVAERLAAYMGLLDLASDIHELLFRINGLLTEARGRKERVNALDDLAKAQTVAELQAILRTCKRAERDISAMDDQAHELASEVQTTVERVTGKSNDTRLQQFADHLKRQPDELNAVLAKTRELQKRKRELTEAKLAAQEVIEDCQGISQWSEGLCKELRPQIVGAALTGLQKKFAERLIPKKGSPDADDEEKLKAFLSRLRRRLTNYQSEYPVRKQQLKRCQSQATPILQNLTIVQEPALARSFGEVKSGAEQEMATAEESLRRAANVIQGLERQLEIEEKRLAFSATGKQEDKRIEMIQQQAVEAVRSALGTGAVDDAAKNMNGEVRNGLTPQQISDGSLIVPNLSTQSVYAAPPISEQSTMSAKDCLTLLDTLSASLTDREHNPLREKYNELQKYQADPSLTKEVYNDEAVAADNKLYQDMHDKANRTEAMLVSLKAQVAYQTECDSWFQMAADSLEWIREMQVNVDETYDWRVTLRRFGVEVRPNQRATLELADCGPKGSGGISKRLARHQRLAVDIRSGLQMVKKICEKGEELKRTRAENAAKIGDTITQLTNAAGRLHDACEEKSRRMTEANELVQWGYQMDEAAAQAAATERELTVDDYGVGESGLSKLLDKHTALEHNITEVQAARGQSLLNKAEKAQADGHFAGAQMVQEAKKLNASLTTVLPQLAVGRREALQIMLTWRTLEKEIRAESIWLKEKLNSPLLDVAKSEKPNYADTSRDLKALTELAAQVVTKDRTFKELTDRVNGLLEDKQTISNQTRRKTVVLALGSVGDAVQSIAQLTSQKSELEEKIASIGELLVMNYTILQLLNEIKEAEEWIRVRILPVRQLAPMTDNNGTKAASQNVKNMLVDAASFNRDTIGPLTLRVQHFVAQQSSSGSTNRRAVIDAEKRTDGLPGPDLVRLMQKHAGTIGSQGGRFRSRVDDLQHETECLTSRYEMLTRYLDLVGKKLQLHTELYKFNVQADDLNRWLSEIEQTVVSNEYGSDLDECGILLSKFNEQFEASSSIGASRLSALSQKSEELIDLAAALRESLKSEEQKSASMLAQIPDQEGWVSVPQAFQEMQDHVKMDETSTRERQEELNRKWASIRTGMKTRKEALQSAMQIHKFMSDTEDLLEWIAAKSPQARSRNIGIALLGKLSGKTADEETRKVSSMEKARSEQEKLRHEISAMQKQMDKLDREQTRLCKEYPNRTEEVRTRWQTVQTEWNTLRKSVQANQQRLSEAQMVTEWTDRCNLFISWLEERRLAILAVRVIPTELDEAKRLLDEHIAIKTQLSKKSPEKDAIERFVI